MKRFISILVLLMAGHFLYAEGLQEAVKESQEAAAETSNLFYMKEGINMGQELFINVIAEMERNGETNYDMEYIVNNYVDYVASHTFLKSYTTTFDWMRFIGNNNNILIFHYAFDTFLDLLEMYLWKKEELVYDDGNEEYDDQ